MALGQVMEVISLLLAAALIVAVSEIIRLRSRLRHMRNAKNHDFRNELSSALGRIAEQLVPFTMAKDLGVDLRDLRFLGSPVDYIVFKGLHRGEVEEILFVEVKAGKRRRLTDNERAVKRAVESGRIRWVVYDASWLTNEAKELAGVDEQGQRASD